VLRLQQWPAVSGAKRCAAGSRDVYRMRTGDYRVQFRIEGEEGIIERVGHRDRFYED
jgi:mRNA-degrading endonuclease RelE of RelBE toxin-antitoxin system